MSRKKKPGIEIILACDKCGKQPPVDTEQSNENWCVYKVSEPCECGGRWTHKIVETND